MLKKVMYTRRKGWALRAIWRRSTGTSDCRCKNTTQHKHRHKHTLGRYRNRAASHVHIRIKDSGCNRREPSAHGDAHSEATSRDVASEYHIANMPRGGAVRRMRRKGGCCARVAWWWLRDSAPAESGWKTRGTSGWQTDGHL